MITSRLSRYVFWQTLIGVLGAAVVLIAVIVLIDFVETSRDIATRADISALRALELTFLKAPLLVQDTMAFIVLFGVLFTFFRLSRRSELIVMRASGYSAWRIMAPAAALAVALGLFSAGALNPAGAAANARFESLRDDLLRGALEGDRAAGPAVWLRESDADGFTVITASGIEPDEAMLLTPVFRRYVRNEQTGAPTLDRRVTAERAALRGGFWTLTGAVETQPGAATRDLGEIALPTDTRRQALFERVRSPGATSFWALPGVIDSARAAGLSSRAYELRFHGLLAQPLILLAAGMLAIAATFRLHRSGGAAGFAAVGAGAGFVLYFTQELLLGLGASGALDPMTAAWTAPALFALGGLFFIAATEDG
ncbi:MAG: LptF/LptG family permease [Oceanicaulis sp.]